ncbi:MAG: hypothetical protein HY698_03055 [Deltaproteobacteria bacterium]|nr:hypothetical protein [Deltaproteobacteria bacterium]
MKRTLVVLVLAVSSCAPKVKPGLKVSGSPEGKGEPDTLIAVNFDRPMVSKELLGREIDPSKAPMRLSPKVTGRFEWASVDMLAFRPAQPLTRSTKFTVEIPAGTKAIDGFGLAESYRFHFETPRIELSASVEGGEIGEKWASSDQKVTLVSSQPVSSDEIPRRCRYHAGEKSIAVRLEVEQSEPRKEIAVRPAQQLPRDTECALRCDAELHGVEGPLGLAAPFEKRFRTLGPFRVVAVTPRGDGVDIDEAALEIKLSNPVLPEEPPLTIEPAVAGFPARTTRFGTSIHFSFEALEPDTEYTIKIDKSLRDRFGQALEKEHLARFRTGSPKPGFSMETGQWVVESSRPYYYAWTRNLTHVETHAALLDEDALLRLLPKLDWWDEDPVDLGALDIPSTKMRLDVSGPPLRYSQFPLEPERLLGRKLDGSVNGFYYYSVKAPEAAREDQQLPHEVLLNITDLGVSAKLSQASGLVWVTRLSTGEPVPGAQVTVRTSTGKTVWKGTTDDEGIAVTPGKAKLLPTVTTPPSAFEEDEGGDEEGDAEEEDRPRLLVFARVGKDVTFLDPERSGAYASWNFNVPFDSATHAERLRGFLHSDRGLYRPGDTVHAKGLVRTMRLGEGLRVPQGRAKVEVSDPQGNVVLEREIALSRFGGFAFDVSLPGDARLGDYTMKATFPQGVFRESFAVEEYRPATFEVVASPQESRAEAGQSLKLKAEGRYFYGAPVRNGRLTWRVHRRTRSATFAAFPGFTFHDERAFNRWVYYAGSDQEFVTEADGKLDDKGMATLAVDIPKELENDHDYLIEAQVTDETNQSISSHFAVPVDRSSTVLGLNVGGWVARVGTPQKVQLVAVDPTGRRVAAEAKLKVIRREWNCAWEAWGYRGSYRCEEKESQVEEKTVSISAHAPTEFSFTPKSSGSMWIIAEGKDARGRATKAATSLWAWGGGDAGWRASDGATFDIVADKESYRPGDTARLLLKTPVGEATGLLTIEREGVLERRLFKLEPGKEVIEVPISENFGPNVYASVLLARGRSGPGARGLPVLKMGLINLPVEVKEGRRLQVSVTTDREEYRPGETVAATITVRDAEGKPVSAEVSVAAADEGVLSLVGFKTPDPLTTFYAPWGLAVSTASQIERLIQIPEPDQERLATGGDAAGRPGTLRSRMVATAYWNPALQTDSTGHARVELSAPDNLTAFRLMAVAADAGDRFGSGDRRFKVSKPFQVHSAYPRFFTSGDEAHGGVVVHNETGKPGIARVEVLAQGVELVGPSQKEVQVPQGGRVAVMFPVKATREGQAVLKFTARLADEQDGLEVTLPVHPPTPYETEVLSEGSGDVVDLVPKVPEGAIIDTSVLSVSLDPHGLAGMEEGLRELIEYPYGCLEQTTSRVIPLVMVEELSHALALEGLDGPALQRFLKIGIEKIGRHQAADGGFSLWPNGQAEPYLTAYALWGLHLARQAGHAVDNHRLEAGISYLIASLSRGSPESPIHDELGDLGGRAFALHVLALLNRPQPGAAAKLLEQEDALPRFGKAFLGRALAASLGPNDPGVAKLLDELEAQAELDGERALVREPEGERLAYYMSDDVRTTAIVLDTFLALRPDSPLVPKLVRGLVAKRRGGAWETTQDNLYSLVALSRYAKDRPKATEQAIVTLGDKVLLDERLSGAAGGLKRLSVPLASVIASKVPLRVQVKGGRAFWSAQLRFRRDLAHQAERGNQLTVRRELLDPDTGKPKGSFRVGDVVRVRVTYLAPEDRNHLAIVDRLPAAFEPINTRLRTASVSRPVRPAQSDDGEEDEGDWDDTWWSRGYQELRDERVGYFTQHAWKGVHTFEYLARVTTAGKFVAPAASGEEMYRPEINARTAMTTLEVAGR